MVVIEKVIGTPKKGLILLAARGTSPELLLNAYRGVKDVVIYSIAGPGGQWYPVPNGPNDQRESLRGLPRSVKLVKGYVKRLARDFDHHLIHLAGHSAGAVVALQVVAHSQEALGSVHVHCGAILDPDGLPQAVNKTPILVFHSENDPVFSWEQRYLPMKAALVKNGYNCHFIERTSHGHSLRNEDVKTACEATYVAS